ncbi:oxygenase MpaB family protein [Streptomyces hebeiensis]|uniref:Oxygenase MpaB family protein n=1 Tax=Streptomyces hebeiensis TaxID=229486 RepID=A0ABP4FG67_9ACTN
MRTDEDERRAHAVYRHMALVDFADDLRLGLNLGFYRTFAVPSIAAVLTGTGKMVSRPRVRAKATGELMYTLIEHGLDTPRGRAAIDALNRLHARLQVGQEEFVYVLAAFCVAPLRWIDAHSWRRTTEEEKDAAHRFYAGLADRMELTGVPGSYADFARWMDDYEERVFARTEDGQRLYGATQELLTDRFPGALAPVVRMASNALLDDRLRAAFAARRPAWPVRGLVGVGLALRRAGQRRAARATAHRRPTVVDPAAPSSTDKAASDRA